MARSFVMGAMGMLVIGAGSNAVTDAQATATASAPAQPSIASTAPAGTQASKNATGPAADLREAASRLVPKIVSTPEVAGSATRVNIVIKALENKTAALKAADLEVATAKLAAAMNAEAKDGPVAFMQERAAPVATADAPARQTPQHALSGVLYDGVGGANLLQLKLTSLSSGEVIWSGSMEIASLK
jgi:PBP1b-binding outer membrane lipoprotein LpoB